MEGHTGIIMGILTLAWKDIIYKDTLHITDKKSLKIPKG
jgi:hypothetical protein